MSSSLVLIGIFTLFTAVSMARLVLWQTRAGTRAPVWRFVTLLVLQPVFAALLYLTLMPPPVAGEGGTLVVATRDAHGVAGMASDHIVALPEAPAGIDAVQVPDLATALRTYPQVRRLRIVGAGLEARDREAVAGRALTFDPSALPQGLTGLDLPSQAAPGAAFHIGGRVSGAAKTVELADPAGHRVDAVAVAKDGSFVVTGAARAAGPALFSLRLVDDQHKILQETSVPVWTAQEAAPRVLLLAGAPGPDVKYLRRWATDAELPLHAQFSLGGGIQLDQAPVAVTTASLRDIDLVILDERSWASLGDGGRAAIVDAVHSGMGLLLRVTGPVPDITRQQWRALGLSVANSDGSLKAPAAIDSDAGLARRGPGTQDAPSAITAGSDAPPLGQTVTAVAADGVPLLRDAAGKPFGLWRLMGRGRVAIWTTSETYNLVLSGEGDRYGELWSEVFATLSRSQAGTAPQIDALARVGQRVALCGLNGPTEVLTPDGQTLPVMVDPGTGDRACAAVWPAKSGWHLVRQHGADDAVQAWPVYVWPQDALAGVRAAQMRDATLRLVATDAGKSQGAASTHKGPSWPWFLAWLVAAGALWWFERARPRATAKA